MGEREPKWRPDVPEWAQKERLSDQLWLQDNFHILWPAAKTAFNDFGRGAIVVDTISQPIPGAGHPFGYFSREQLEEYDDEDTKRMVREYKPKSEFVILLLKAENCNSTYRIQTRRKRR